MYFDNTDRRADVVLDSIIRRVSSYLEQWSGCRATAVFIAEHTIHKLNLGLLQILLGRVPRNVNAPKLRPGRGILCCQDVQHLVLRQRLEGPQQTQVFVLQLGLLVAHATHRLRLGAPVVAHQHGDGVEGVLGARVLDVVLDLLGPAVDVVDHGCGEHGGVDQVGQVGLFAGREGDAHSEAGHGLEDAVDSGWSATGLSANGGQDGEMECALQTRVDHADGKIVVQRLECVGGERSQL